jgi:hypothetical protein
MTNESRTTNVTTSQREPDREQRIFTFKATQLIWLLLGILETLIVLRIGLKLVGANPDNQIVSMIYGFTALFLIPFQGVIKSPSTGKYVLELFSLFAMVIYALIAWAGERIVWLIFYRPRHSAVAVTETTTSEQHSNQ